MKKKRFEFSKIILILVIATYFVGVYIGIKTTLLDASQLGVLLAFIGTPTATAIAFYSWKAKAENIVKIKQENPEIIGSPVDFNSISQ